MTTQQPRLLPDSSQSHLHPITSQHLSNSWNDLQRAARCSQIPLASVCHWDSAPVRVYTKQSTESTPPVSSAIASHCCLMQAQMNHHKTTFCPMTAAFITSRYDGYITPAYICVSESVCECVSQNQHRYSIIVRMCCHLIMYEIVYFIGITG